MKEFVEKLIERLEESQERYEDVAFAEMNENGQTLDFEYAHGKKDGVSESISIVNQLAEETSISKMETVGWIPCSERLPEVDTDVLVCFANDTDCVIAYRTVMFESRYNEVWVNSSTGNRIITDILAWMPLPAPYQSKGE